jgi:hypothetical protein
MASTLDKGGGLIDSMREWHFLASHVVVEFASTSADQIADAERDLDRVTAETGLIAADDHIAALRLTEQPSQILACMLSYT